MSAVMQIGRLKPRRGGTRMGRTVRRVLRSAAAWLRPTRPTPTELVFEGGYASSDGRMARTKSRIRLQVAECEDGTLLAGDFDGLPIQNFRPADDAPWAFRWEVHARGAVVTVRGFVARTGDGDTLYMSFDYRPAGGRGPQLDVYGEYRLRK